LVVVGVAFAVALVWLSDGILWTPKKQDKAVIGVKPSPGEGGSREGKVVSPARLVIESQQTFANEPLPLGIAVKDGSGGEKITLVGFAAGTMLSAGDSWEVTLFGRGAHGSMPQKSIDPVVMAASTVMRLQTVVSREGAMTDGAVVTVGTLRAGMNENVIPDRALLRLNVRTFEDQVRGRVLSAIKRIVEAEAAASGATKPPEFSVLSEYPLTRNDETATRRVAAAFERRFGPDRVREIAPATASEDFSLFAAAWGVPAVFWVVGGIDPDTFSKAEKAGKVDELPANHAPDFAPVLHPTLCVGVEAMLAAAGVWLAAGK